MQPGVLPEEGLQALLIPLPGRFGALFVQLPARPVPVPFGGIRGRFNSHDPVPGPRQQRGQTLHLAPRHRAPVFEGRPEFEVVVLLLAQSWLTQSNELEQPLPRTCLLTPARHPMFVASRRVIWLVDSWDHPCDGVLAVFACHTAPLLAGGSTPIWTTRNRAAHSALFSWKRVSSPARPKEGTRQPWPAPWRT